MYNFPSDIEYLDSLLNGDFSNLNHREFEILKDSKGDVLVVTGQNSIVCTAKDNNGSRKGIKLFYYQNNERESRYRKITHFTKSIGQKFFINIEYFHEFVDVYRTHGIESFPGLLMDWVEGKTLGHFIREMKMDLVKMKKVLNNFKELSLFILDTDFSHCDLKHDNIIVDTNLDLKLIDYDGIYLKDFGGQKSSELGTPSFQHPKRTSNDFNENVDDFSILTIYTSLLAITKYPKWYDKFNDQQNLLFTLEDFLAPHQSELFRLMDGDKELKKYSFLIKQSLDSENIYLPELKNYLNGIFPKPEVSITVYPEKILEGSKYSVFWKTKNAEAVYVNNTKVSIQGELNLKAKAKEVLSVKLESVFGNIEEGFPIKILPLPKISSFKPQQQKIEFGKSTTIHWQVTNAEKVELSFDGKSKLVSMIDRMEVTPLKETVYQLVVTALDGKTTIQKEISIQVFHRVEIQHFNTSSILIPRGLEIEFSWNILHAQQIVLKSNDGLNENVKSNQIFKFFPTKSTSYWLEAKNDLFQVKSNSLRIEVDNAPQMTRIPSFFEENQIPLIDFKMPELQSVILDETVLEFERIMHPKRSFSLTKMINSILKK